MSKPVTIVCWKWKGWRRKDYYTAKHVNTLARMLRDNISVPYRLVCITDDPAGITECETFPLWEDDTGIFVGVNRPNCFLRLKIFSEEMKEHFGDVVVSIDLDTVILGDITHIISDTADIKLAKGTVSKYNGSFFLHRTGMYTKLWSALTKHAPDQIAKYEMKTGTANVGSDQAWMSMNLENAPVWDTADGFYFYRRISGEPTPDNALIVFFPGQIKPWHMECFNTNPDLYIQYRKYFDGFDSSSSN